MKLTKAYIVEKKDNTYKVRIPIYHGIEGSSNATTDDELPYATVATIKGAANIYTAGDIVYVDFEENDLSKPVIIGGLLLDKKTNSTLDIDFDSINVKTRAILPATTTIGNVTSTELGTLKGISKNIQKQFNDILNCSSTYDATYITNQFDDNAKWILEDNGLIVQSNFLDENTEQQIDTFNHILATHQTANKTFTLTDGSILYQSDGYDKDYRLRLNWQGVNVIKNDAVKMSMGLYARNYWNLEKGNKLDSVLPQGYIQLDAIKLDGECYFVTDYFTKLNTKVEICFDKASAVNKWLFGSRTASGAKDTFGLYINSSNALWFQMSGSTPGIISTGSLLNTSVTAIVDRNYMIINGVQINNSSFNINQHTESTTPLCIGTMSDSNQYDARRFIGEIRSFIIYEDDVIVRHYVPCKNENLTVGLYEVKQGRFIVPQGAGNVSAGTSSIGNYLAQPEYTWRPTIQSYTNRSDLAQATINANTHNEKKINTGYFPYSMQLNPDGGDVLIGRGGLVSIIDHHDDAWQEGVNPGEKQGLQIGKVFIFADDKNSLKQQDIATGITKPIGSSNASGGAAGANFFVLADNWVNTSGSFVQTLTNSFTFNGIIYRISLDGSKLYYKDGTEEVSIETTYVEEVNYNSGVYKYFTFEINGNTYQLYHRGYVSPYVDINKSRQVAIEGLFKQYAHVDEQENITYDLERVYSGFVELSVELTLGMAANVAFSSNSFSVTHNGVTTKYTISVNTNGDGTLTISTGGSVSIVGYAFELTTPDGVRTTYKITYNSGSTTAGIITQFIARMPITASEKIQLGSLATMSSVNTVSNSGASKKTYVPVWLDLQATMGLGWENIYYNFILEITPNIVNPSDINFQDVITLDITNKGNYISTFDLSTDNVINFTKGNLVMANKQLATVNVSAHYIGVDVSGVYQSTITPIDNPDYTETI